MIPGIIHLLSIESLDLHAHFGGYGDLSRPIQTTLEPHEVTKPPKSGHIEASENLDFSTKNSKVFVLKISVRKCIQTPQKCMRTIQHLRLNLFGYTDTSPKSEIVEQLSLFFIISPRSQISVRGALCMLSGKRFWNKNENFSTISFFGDVSVYPNRFIRKCWMVLMHF